MSTSSGLTVSPEVIAAYAAAVNDDTRFILVSIREESLQLDQSIPPRGATLEEDLVWLPDSLDDNVPVYILARLDDEDKTWLFISYVPDTATVRNKMLYASSRSILSKSLGDQKLKDSLFATTKADLTPEAYAAHVRSNSAPQPMSARELEMRAVKEAEWSGTVSSTQARTSHLADTVGVKWSQEVTDAVASLADANSQNGNLVVISIDLASETLVLVEHRNSTLEELTTDLPASEPSYSFFAWDHTVSGASKRDILFVYACPSSSPIKSRMIYSSGAAGAVQTAKSSLKVIVAKRLETSDPADLDIAFIKRELEPAAAGGSGVAGDEKKPFARPRGPARKR